MTESEANEQSVERPRHPEEDELRRENTRLRQANQALEARLESLMSRVAALERAILHPAGAPAAAGDTATPVQPSLSRRTLLSGAGVGAVAALTGIVIARPRIAYANSGTALVQYMDFQQPVKLPPLDSSVTWTRTDPGNVGTGYTNTLVALVSDNTQQNSYAWPQYIELRATSSPLATQASSQSVGSTVRLFNRSTGSPWIAGFHSEVHHGQDWVPGSPDIGARGTSLGFNCEVTRRSGAGAVIGVNVQNTTGSNSPGDHAVNIQSGSPSAIWQNGIHFDPVPGGGIAGNIGINMEGHYNMGIDLGDNSLRMNADQSLILERFGTVRIRFNSSTGNVEIVNGNSVYTFARS